MIDLGFAEEADDFLLKNVFFVSKLGGKPAWLELKNIPEQHEVICELCNEPCAFLCQIYAPSEVDPEAGFHRTIFLFICKNGKCCQENSSRNLIAFRSQLPRKNDFYDYEPPIETEETKEIPSPVNLCQVCGCRGPLFCGKCKTISYCGQLHQKIDWRSNHKENCGKSEVNKHKSDFLFPEYEIVLEQEEMESTPKETEKEAEKRRLKEYEELKSSGKIGEMAEISEQDLNEFAESKEDKTFGKFKKAIKSSPEQILRYDRNGSVLWISRQNILNSSEIPKCESCKGPRTFEFQVMPQTLNYLKNYDLDWGILAIYTCKNDCDVKSKYVKEFVYKQDIVKTEDDESEIDIEKLQANVSKQQEMPSSSSNSGNKKNPKKEKKAVKKPQTNNAFKDNDDWE